MKNRMEKPEKEEKKRKNSEGPEEKSREPARGDEEQGGDSGDEGPDARREREGERERKRKSERKEGDRGKPSDIPSVILVHGAWCGGWVWAALQSELQKREIHSFALDLPGHGASCSPFSSSLEGDAQFVADTVNTLAKRGVHKPILVGHSYGGAVITQAAVLNPQVSHLVYVSAACPNSGEAVGGAEEAISDWTPHPANGFGSLVHVSSDGTCSVALTAAQFLFGEDASHADLAAFATSRMGKHPLATFSGKVSGAPRELIPSTYIVTSQDRVMLTQNQEKLASRCKTQRLLQCAHMPQMTNSEQLAALLAEIAGETAEKGEESE